MINKRDLVRSRTPSDTEMKYQLSQIPNKVDKEPNKGLSTNDFTNEYKQEIDRSVKSIHTHSNLNLLNTINTNDLNNWNNAYNTISELINPAQLYNNEEGSNEDIILTSTNYQYIFIIYGNETDYDNKLITPIDKQFCITLNEESSYYKFSETGLEKQSGSDAILIYKVLGYFEKGEM